MTKRLTTRLGLLLALTSLALLGVAAAAQASPVWELNSSSNTTAAPGGGVEYVITARNVGDEATNLATYTFKIELPPGITGVEMVSNVLNLGCSPVSGESVIECKGNSSLAPFSKLPILFIAGVDRAAAGLRTASFKIEGGNAPAPDATVDPVRISADPPPFGIDAFDSTATDPAGATFTQAGGHPAEFTTELDFNTVTDPSPVVDRLHPVEPLKDVTLDLPPGFLGNPAGVATCTVADLVNVVIEEDAAIPRPLCPPESQVGTAQLKHSGNPGHVDTENILGSIPVFNMETPPGVAARFGFDFAKQLTLIDVGVRSGGDYGAVARVTSASEAAALSGSSITFWGVPSDPRHFLERACPGQNIPPDGGETCSSDAPPQPFFRMPAACTAPGEGLPTTISIDSWQHLGVFDSRTIKSHQAPGYPLSPDPSLFPAGYSGPEAWGEEVGPEGCGKVPFEPSFSLDTTTDQADSPTGLSVDLGIPQDCWDAKATVQEAEESICQSDLHKAVVTLPQGMSVNPSSAGGLEACSPAQIGLVTPVGQAAPIHFTEAPARCPGASKIGSVEVHTPLLNDPLKGFVYLAGQEQNPFGSLLSMYLVAEGSGVIVKQAGKISVDPNTGALTTSFEEAPQTPFSNLHLDLYSGPRAALRTPASCGTFAAQGTLTPWSGNGAVAVSDSFGISKGCGGGFDPKLSAGTQNPLAGNTSPFSLRVTRADGEAELGAITATLPPGLTGYLKGIPYCSDAALAAVSGNEGTGRSQESSPSCPAASQVGKVTVGAGAGPNPFYTQSGKAYLSGPYKGAPVSLAVVTPAVAGPFDLGSVVVRNAIHVDPESGQLTVTSDPIPHILHGIPLDLRDIRVEVNRERFTLNPTNCEAMQIGSQIASTTGAGASPSVHFQVSGCERLGFKPKLGIKLFGKPNRGAHPALRAVLAFPKAGGANLARAQVALPHSEFLDQGHIRTICTRVQFAADACPPGSIYGYAKATSPLVDYPVYGPVYLRSSSHKLPDLVLALHGPASQPVEIDAVGRIDSIHGGIRTTFESTPDLPLEKVTLSMKGGAKGLIQNSRNICAHAYRADVELGGQNGALQSLRPTVRSNQCTKAKKHRGGRR